MCSLSFCSWRTWKLFPGACSANFWAWLCSDGGQTYQRQDILICHYGFRHLWSRSNNNNNNNNNNRIQRRYSRLFTISSQRRELSPTLTLKWPGRNRVQITCNTSSAYHVQHVVLRATRNEGTAQLLSVTELKSHLF